MDSKLEKDINKLTFYVKNLKGFIFYNYQEFNKEFFYRNHMGAIITDGILQAGIKWETVVKPRLKNLLKYRSAKTTTGFYNLYNQKGLRYLINFKGKRKIKTIKDVVRLFIKEKIESPGDFKKWLKQSKNIERIKKIHGIGDKTTDYFKILARIPSIAVDRHLMNFLKKAKIKVNNYEEAHQLVNKTADDLKINKSLLDYSIWKYMSSKNKKCKKCKNRRNSINSDFYKKLKN